MTAPAYPIVRVSARRVWDSRGRPTVEAEVHLPGGVLGRATAPAGASTGRGEALDLRDGGDAFGGYDVTRAIRQVRDIVDPALRGLDASDQAGLDRVLIDLDGTPDKRRLGGNACIAVSMAALHAAAGAARQPLWRYLLGEEPALLPLPEIQIFGGGAHAGRRVDVQDFMVMAVGANSFAEALDWTAEVYRAAGARMAAAGRLHGVADEGGWWPAFDTNEEALEFLVRAIEDSGRVPGDEIAISLDVAASELYRDGRYHLGLERRAVDSDGLSDLLTGWIDRYPIVSVEDPLAEDDHAGMQRFTAAVGGRVQVVGDDYLVTDAARVERAARDGACNALLVKPNQAGTVTETRAALDAARRAGMGTIVSARSGETEDVTIAHLAVGWRSGQLKVGSFARSERMAKWNEVLRIEEALAGTAQFAGAPSAPPPLGRVEPSSGDPGDRGRPVPRARSTGRPRRRPARSTGSGTHCAPARAIGTGPPPGGLIRPAGPVPRPRFPPERRPGYTPPALEVDPVRALAETPTFHHGSAGSGSPLTPTSEEMFMRASRYGRRSSVSPPSR